MSTTRKLRSASKPEKPLVIQEGHSISYGPAAKKRRRRHRNDKTYNPRSYGAGHGDGALNILTDAKKEVVDKDGTKKAKKTNFQFASPIKELLDAKSLQSLKEKAKAVATYRPATAVEWFEDGVPKVLETPGKTRLNYRGGAQRVGYSYVNRSPLKVSTDDSIKPEFAASAEAKALVPNPLQVKEQTVLITQAMIAATNQELCRNQGLRAVSQAAVMKSADAHIKDASATKIAEAAGIAPGVPKNFGHANGHQFLGSKSQKPLNLTIVTTHSNGAYLAQAEYVLKYLISQSKEGVLFTTHAYCVEGTHFQKRIDVTLEVPDHFKLSMTFDGQQLSPTDKSSKDYMLGLAKVLVEQRIRNEKPKADSPAKPALSASPDIIFSRTANRRAILAAKEQAEADKENRDSQVQPAAASAAPPVTATGAATPVAVGMFRSNLKPKKLNLDDKGVPKPAASK